MSNITLVDEKVDYLSYQSQEVCRNVTAYEAYKLMTFHQLKWLAGLFKIRDFLGKIVGIKSINVFNKLEETEPDIGSKVHFFTIIEKQKDTLALTIRDHHLDVCLCIRIIETKDYKNKLYVITSVKIHKFRGNYIWHLFQLSILILIINYSIIFILKKENGYIHKKNMLVLV